MKHDQDQETTLMRSQCGEVGGGGGGGGGGGSPGKVACVSALLTDTRILLAGDARLQMWDMSRDRATQPTRHVGVQTGHTRGRVTAEGARAPGRGASDSLDASSPTPELQSSCTPLCSDAPQHLPGKRPRPQFIIDYADRAPPGAAGNNGCAAHTGINARPLMGSHSFTSRPVNPDVYTGSSALAPACRVPGCQSRRRATNQHSPPVIPPDYRQRVSSESSTWHPDFTASSPDAARQKATGSFALFCRAVPCCDPSRRISIQTSVRGQMEGRRREAEEGRMRRERGGRRRCEGGHCSAIVTGDCAGTVGGKEEASGGGQRTPALVSQSTRTFIRQWRDISHCARATSSNAARPGPAVSALSSHIGSCFTPEQCSLETGVPQMEDARTQKWTPPDGDDGHMAEAWPSGSGGRSARPAGNCPFRFLCPVDEWCPR
ncbi:unnamed protein product [Pleuronectes platessa]|uniref:Uncharacterized protein n=1 Tax=Pleuronectes platessa TaxID=8262 RepID=A0A9N7UW78_PLEPL|nr:unnamed protein product [Pleuronectes platessa]